MTLHELENSLQLSFDQIGRPLSTTTFVVVDLETTGGSPVDSKITEFGAVKIRGGEVLGEFKTFVNPEMPIPAYITVLTGITDAMVVEAPTIAEILPNFLAFCGSENETVLVAHNAPFDIGFLKANARTLGYTWPNYHVLDTVRIARIALAKDEVTNYKLSSLATFFRTEVKPTHRALDDAQTTVEVFHGLIERLGNRGIQTLEDLREFTHRVTPEQRQKKYLSEKLPAAPGVYIFRDRQGEPLYIGTSRNLRSRVRKYFTAAETRSRIREMISLVADIDFIICPTPLEAHIREIRLISRKQPRYNRRSRFQEKITWIKLTQETFPRLSVVRSSDDLRDDSGWCGPFSGAATASLALEALHEISMLRQCNPRITRKSQLRASPCALYDMAKCKAPCIGAEDELSYLEHVSLVKSVMHENSSIVEETLLSRMQKLAEAERFEEASEVRDRYTAFIHGVSRGQRVRALTKLPRLLVAKKRDDGWEFVEVKYGKLAGTAVATQKHNVKEVIDSLKATSEVVNFKEGVLPHSSHEEVERLLDYLDSEIRIVEIEGEWTLPTYGPASAYFSFKKADAMPDAL